MRLYIEAADLMGRYPSIRSLARYIADRVVADPKREPHWVAVAQACEDIRSATRH
jgi:hypothetical protein